ncbi:outer membrane efflux protein [Chloroherpeton thalassium ATCC 35110]|uniref:Outer membrane efflux protein n=1 Tax=Chloroherpeton thalassium (strain ATCC 35110 / GB-78) TaxID=517418 RepID=B3QZ88_CHLT3|nr:TolC family protein [Chloroherpeton thalassium]ACF13781.1 outer membrane efflux protein [Chloroherpeton thalassium ATCC 35110]
MRRILIFFLTNFLFLTEAMASDTLQLETCYKFAEQKYPLSKKIRQKERIEELKQGILTSYFLPQVSLNSKATYQSQLLELPFTIPGAESMEFYKDNYEVSLNVEQLVFDGGSVAAQKDIAELEKELAVQNVAVDLHALHEKVNDAYFAILLADTRKSSLELLKKELQAKLAIVESQVRNGLATESNADILKAELLKTNQNLIETDDDRKAAGKVLEEYIDLPITKNTRFGLPKPAYKPNKKNENNRPEYKAFALSRDLLEGYDDLYSAEYYPKLSGFFEYAYGRPSLNVFETDFKSYFIAGVQAKWTLWNWRRTDRNREVLQIQKKQSEADEETFSKNLSIAVYKSQSEIEKLEALLKTDREIIDLRERISDQASSKLDNGLITATDYLTDLNAKIQAQLTMNIHQIQLVKAKVQYLNIIGDM